MPLTNIHVLRGRPEAELRLLLDAVQDAQVAAFGVPETDRYQLLTQHEPYELVARDTGLGFTRTSDIVMIHFVSRARAEDAKVKLYERITANLQERLGIAPSDVIVSITENDAADWSFGGGIAQFLTGDLP